MSVALCGSSCNWSIVSVDAYLISSDEVKSRDNQLSHLVLVGLSYDVPEEFVNISLEFLIFGYFGHFIQTLIVIDAHLFQIGLVAYDLLKNELKMLLFQVESDILEYFVDLNLIVAPAEVPEHFKQVGGQLILDEEQLQDVASPLDNL